MKVSVKLGSLPEIYYYYYYYYYSKARTQSSARYDGRDRV